MAKKRRKRTRHPPIDPAARGPRPKPKSTRKDPRVPVRRPVRLQSDDGRLAGETRDIGGGGTFVKTDDVLEVGAEVVLKMQLEADAAPVLVRGLVVRAVTDGPDRGMAIAFQSEGLHPDRETIASFVREQDLDIRTERLEAAKREFLEKVRAFEAERARFERRARAEPGDVVLQDELRQAKREYLRKLQHTEARRRDLEAELARERA